MRLLRFFSSDGSVHLGVRQENKVRDLGVRDPLDPISEASIASAPELPMDGLRLDAPIRAVPKLLALAGNYRKHVAESGFSGPASGIWIPQIFWKPTTSIIGPIVGVEK